MRSGRGRHERFSHALVGRPRRLHPLYRADAPPGRVTGSSSAGPSNGWRRRSAGWRSAGRPPSASRGATGLPSRRPPRMTGPVSGSGKRSKGQPGSSGPPARPPSTSGGGSTGCSRRSPGRRMTASAKEIALAEAEAIAREDTACCHAIGEHGARLLPDSCTVLTHCNPGALACSSWGTALGVIRSAVKRGKGREGHRLRDPPAPAGGPPHRVGTRAGRDRRDRHHGFHGRVPDADGCDRCGHRRGGPDHLRRGLQQDRHLHARGLRPVPRHPVLCRGPALHLRSGKYRPQTSLSSSGAGKRSRPWATAPLSRRAHK